MAERFGNDLVLLERLAAGGMAEVYRAKQMGYGGFEKTVAIKRILPNFASDEEFKSMFRAEANLCAGLQHPNIAQVFGNGEYSGYLYLLMEFVDGRNLRQFLARCDRRKAKIPIELTLHVITEASKGLDYAHKFVDEKSGQRLNIVHRDMSPQNIMLSWEGDVKIVDFGIAKITAQSESTRAGVLKGKFGYMSPEQAHGQKLDPRSDIFALGIILFELLTQRRLFTSDDDMKTLQLVKDCRVPRPSKYNPLVAPELDRIVLKALAKDRSERYANATDLYSDLILFKNQKYPKFIPTEFSRFLKEIFSEDILEDKKKREKMAAEAPALLGATFSPPPQKKTEDPDSTDPGSLNSEDKTQVSQSRSSADKELPSKSSAEFLELQDAEDIKLSSFRPAAPTPLENELPPPKVAIPPLIKVERVVAAPIPSLSRSGFTEASGNSRISKQSKGLPNSVWYAAVIFLMMTYYYVNQQGGQGNRAPAKVDASVETPTKVEQVEAEVNLDAPAPTQPPTAAVAVNEESSAVAPIEPSAPVENANDEDRVPANVQVISINDLQNRAPAMAAKAPPGFLTLESFPRANQIYINERLLVDEKGVPIKTPLRRFALPMGKYLLVIKSTIFGKKWQEKVEIKPDIVLQRDVVLK